MHPGGVGALLDAHLGGGPALTVADETITYADLDRSARSVAAGLRAHGVGPGDRVAVGEPAGRLAVAGLLGAARIGAAAVLVNPHGPPAERRALLATAGARHTATVELLGYPPDGAEPVRGDEAVVLFTSGTTGRPKPVPVPTDVLLTRLDPYRRPERPQVRLVCVPVHHVGGLVGLLVGLAGGHHVVVQPRFDAGDWLRLVDRHRVELTFLVPTMLRRILDHPDRSRTALPSLTAVTYGAAPMPPDLIDRAMTAWPHVGFSNTFGQTETLGGITALSPDDHRDPVRRQSVGRPLPGVDIRIVDGELQVRSPQNTRAGWLGTGDLVHQDADGYLYFDGRVDDIINRAGEKVMPQEVESALLAHPAVREAAVAAVPDPDLGERVAAVVVADAADAAELRTWCRQRLSSFKVPDQIRFVAVIPHTELGKVDRRAVARSMSEQGTADAVHP